MPDRPKPSRPAAKTSSPGRRHAGARKAPKKPAGAAPAPVVAERAQASYRAAACDRRNAQLEFGNVMEVPAAIPEAQPFLKWVGGKAQLLQQFDRLFPKQIDRYFEPFIGGGAVFFHLKHRFPRMRARLCDINDELINAYQAVRDFPRELMRRLDEHLTQYNLDRERYYYLVRSQHHLPRGEIVERAARMIFLNKTCFNGLWRVNARGEFNVPIGSHKNHDGLSLYDRDNLLAANRALQEVELATQDFRVTINALDPGDFAYIDPPYVPRSATSLFTSYAKEEFGASEQRELAAVFAAAAQRGVRLMLSNSDVPLVRELYDAFTIGTVQARRAINRDGAKRGAISELLVRAEPGRAQAALHQGRVRIRVRQMIRS